MATPPHHLNPQHQPTLYQANMYPNGPPMGQPMGPPMGQPMGPPMGHLPPQQQIQIPPMSAAAAAAAGGNVKIADVWVLDTRIAKLGGLDYPMNRNQGFYGLCRVAQAVTGQTLKLSDFKTSETREPKACTFAAGPFFAKGPWHSETQQLAIYKMFLDAKIPPDRIPQDPYGGLVGDDQIHYIVPSSGANFLGRKWDATYMPALRQQIWATEETVYSDELVVIVPRKHGDLSVCIHRVPIVASETEEQMHERIKKQHVETCLGKKYTLGARPPPDEMDKLWERSAHDPGQYTRPQIPAEVWFTRHPEWSRQRGPIVLTAIQSSRLSPEEQKHYKLLEFQKLDPNTQRQWGTTLLAKVQSMFEQYKANGWSVGGFAFRNEWTLQELIKISVAPPVLRPGFDAKLEPCFTTSPQQTGLSLRGSMELMCNQAKRGKGRQGGLVIHCKNETVLRTIQQIAWPTMQSSKCLKWHFIDEDPTMQNNAWAFLSKIATIVGTVPEHFIQEPESKADASFANLVQYCQFRVNVGRDDAVPQAHGAALAPAHFMQSLESRFGGGGPPVPVGGGGGGAAAAP